MQYDRIERIIEDFNKYKQNNKDNLIKYCIKQKSLKRIVEISSLSRDENGLKHPHQKRISGGILSKFKEKLSENISRIQYTENFDELYQAIESCKIKGIGDLTIYDTAHRIGIYLNILPDKVYLHSGTLIGAKKIFGTINKKALKKEEFPEPIKSCNLSCAEIEDLLCLYKDRI